MSWNYLITFFVGVGIYLVCLFVWTTIKRRKNKNKIKQQENEDTEKVVKHDEEEHKD